MKPFFKKPKNKYHLSYIIKYLELEEILSLLKVNKFFIQSIFYINLNLNEKEYKIIDLYNTYRHLSNGDKSSCFKILTQLRTMIENNASKFYEVYQKLESQSLSIDLLCFSLILSLPSQRISQSSLSEYSKCVNDLNIKLFNLNLSETSIGSKGSLILSYFLKYIRNLSYIDLSYNEFDSEDLEIIISSILTNPHIKKLQIDLANCDLTDKHMTSIIKTIQRDYKYKQLITFNLFGNLITSIESITKMVISIKNIFFIFHKNRFDFNIVQTLFNSKDSIKVFDYIDLSYNKISQLENIKDYIIKAKTSRAFNVNTLNLSYNNIDDSSLFHLFSAISKGIYVNHIDLSSNLISDKGISYLKDAFNKLDIKHMNHKYQLLSMSSNHFLLNRLKSIDMSYNKLSNKGVSDLISLLSDSSFSNQIESIGLVDCQITKSEIFYLITSSLKRIKRIILNNNKLSDEDFNQNMKFSYETWKSTMKDKENKENKEKLEIDFGFCKLNDNQNEGICVLMHMSSKFNLSNNDFSENLLIFLTKYNFPLESCVNQLNLSNNKNFQQNSFDFLIENKVIFNNVKELRFSNGVKNINSSYIKSLLNDTCILERLDLSYNQIKGEVLKNLIDFFLRSNSLIEINLIKNKLTEEDFEIILHQIMKFIDDNPYLSFTKYIRIGKNEFLLEKCYLRLCFLNEHIRKIDFERKTKKIFLFDIKDLQYSSNKVYDGFISRVEVNERNIIII